MYTRRFQPSNRFSRFNSSRSSGFSRFSGRGRNMKGGNIHEFIRKASVKNFNISPTPVTEILFSSLNLPESLKLTIARHGYTTLTPIQAQGIPAIRAGKDPQQKRAIIAFFERHKLIQFTLWVRISKK